MKRPDPVTERPTLLKFAAPWDSWHYNPAIAALAKVLVHE
jgi:hypothetical protein